MNKAIELSGGSKCNLSKEIGHDPSFLTNYSKPDYDRMRKSDILLIQHLTGVDVTLIEKKEKEKEVADFLNLDDDFFKKLQDTIFLGVKRVIVRANFEINNPLPNKEKKKDSPIYNSTPLDNTNTK